MVLSEGFREDPSPDPPSLLPSPDGSLEFDFEESARRSVPPPTARSDDPVGAWVNCPMVEDPIVNIGPLFVLELEVVGSGMVNTGSEKGLVAVVVLDDAVVVDEDEDEEEVVDDEDEDGSVNGV